MNTVQKSLKKDKDVKGKRDTPFKRMTRKILAKPFKNLRRPEEDII